MRRPDKKIGLDSIAVVNENTDYGTSVAEAVEGTAKQNNGRSRFAFPTARHDRCFGAGAQLKDKQPGRG